LFVSLLFYEATNEHRLDRHVSRNFSLILQPPGIPGNARIVSLQWDVDRPEWDVAEREFAKLNVPFGR
jgi:hypothetical protein